MVPGNGTASATVTGDTDSDDDSTSGIHWLVAACMALILHMVQHFFIIRCGTYYLAM